MIYVCIYSGADGSYKIGLSDFLEPVHYHAAGYTKTGSPAKLARAFAFRDTEVAAAFYERITTMPFRWIERLVTHGLPAKLDQATRFRGVFGPSSHRKTT